MVTELEKRVGRIIIIIIIMTKTIVFTYSNR